MEVDCQRLMALVMADPDSSEDEVPFHEVGPPPGPQAATELPLSRHSLWDSYEF